VNGVLVSTFIKLQAAVVPFFAYHVNYTMHLRQSKRVASFIDVILLWRHSTSSSIWRMKWRKISQFLAVLGNLIPLMWSVIVNTHKKHILAGALTMREWKM